MRTRCRMFCTAGIAFAVALSGCNKTVQSSPDYLGVTASPRPASVAAGTTVIFTGSVSNNLSLPQWSILDAAQATNSPGTLSTISGSPNAILYTAPATPPLYNVTTGVTQGSVTLDVTVTDPPGTSIPVSSDAVSFVITTPSVSPSLNPLTASVLLGSTQQFFGYALGNLNNTLTWQLTANGVPAAPGVLGTVNVGGTYVAPATMPPTGNAVTLTITSQADPTKTLSAAITLH